MKENTAKVVGHVLFYMQVSRELVSFSGQVSHLVCFESSIYIAQNVLRKYVERAALGCSICRRQVLWIPKCTNTSAACLICMEFSGRSSSVYLLHSFSVHSHSPVVASM